jgi:hypothetical protein
MNLATDNEQVLTKALDRLPRGISPARELWPLIAAQLDGASAPKPKLLRLGFGLAAGLMIGVVSLMSLSARPLVGRAGLEKLESGPMTSERSQLLAVYRDRLSGLDPTTRVRVERDLANVRAAELDLAAALKVSPESPVLSRLYTSTVQQEFDLYDVVVRTTEPVSIRTRL